MPVPLRADAGIEVRRAVLHGIFRRRDAFLIAVGLLSGWHSGALLEVSDLVKH